jgi:YfiH family protein
MKQHAGIGYYTAAPVAGFVYGVADRDVEPHAGIDAWLTGRGAAAVARVTQVHGDRVVAAGEAVPGCEADAVVVGPGEAAVIRVADCVPVILMHRERRRAAAVHAGWRGTFAEIALRALARLPGAAGTVAYVGPAIGACCYEVSAELGARFAAKFGAGPWLHAAGAQPRLDLAALNAELLRRAGVAEVHVEARCTRDSADLHSFRRDAAAAGRLAAFVLVERV